MAHAVPTSTETYILSGKKDNVWVQIVQTTKVVSNNGSDFTIPVTAGTYSELKVNVSAGQGRSWIAINGIGIREN